MDYYDIKQRFDVIVTKLQSQCLVGLYAKKLLNPIAYKARFKNLKRILIFQQTPTLSAWAVTMYLK